MAAVLKFATREQWLVAGVAQLRTLFKKHAKVTVPPVKVSCSWPGGGSARKRIGECWKKAMSKANINEIFISPRIANPVQALDILAHELVHAIDDCQHGHKIEFQRLAKAVGLTEGKPTSASAGPELLKRLQTIADKLGVYPHSTLDLSGRKKKQTFLIKCVCADEECGAVWRMTQSWIDRAHGNNGLLCPVCQSPSYSETI